MTQTPGRAKPAAEPQPFRVAVYTRKSTVKGLDKEDNTLQFQREACADFIKSKRAFGWTVEPTEYNDGGFTGANTDRPALQQLLADAKAGKFEAIAVYKVDRISRSVRDLVSLVEAFQILCIEFVSVSQSFDTSTPIGRLLLNILGSFGQFERETIVERVRDKIGAARRKVKSQDTHFLIRWLANVGTNGACSNWSRRATRPGKKWPPRLYLQRQATTTLTVDNGQRGLR